MANQSSRHDSRTPRARALRGDATPAERRLWRALRLVELPDGHFRRQAPIGPYFADFAHHSLRLAVELDGEQHGQNLGLRRDARRTAYLNEQGYRVLRFWNHEIAENLDGVVETILAAVAERAQRTGGNTRNALAQGIDASVPLPPRRRSGGEGTGGGRI
ncbi:MAG: endonuclease domain-containing protein [Hyphomicrobiales bacterium]|nr:endonuclease domain-containing protein [Hyphomicrobiales bacterium]